MAKLQWETVTYSHEGQVELVEIIPTDPHVESTECSCGPWLAQDCTTCHGEDGGCWQCGGRGLVDYDRWSGEVPWVVHHDDRLE